MINKLIRLGLSCFVCTAILVSSSCGGGGGGSSGANNGGNTGNTFLLSINVSRQSMELSTSQTATITLVQGATNTPINVTIASSDNSIFTVNPTTCNLSTANNSCAVTITANTQQGSAQLSATTSLGSATPVTITVVAFGVVITPSTNDLTISKLTSDIPFGRDNMVYIQADLNAQSSIPFTASLADTYVGNHVIMTIATSSPVLQPSVESVEVVRGGQATFNISYQDITDKSSIESVMYSVNGITISNSISQGVQYLLPVDISETDIQKIIIDNLISGSLLIYLIEKDLGGNKLSANNKDNLLSMLFGQLCQEFGLVKSEMDLANNMLDTNPNVLAMGQGGAYQLNSYASPVLPGDSTGLVNFVLLQKNLNYTVADQDHDVQRGRSTPKPLVYKSFAPIAAAYFHYLYWQLMFAQFMKTDCLHNIENNSFDYLDMLMSAAYNSGIYNVMFTQTLKMCEDPSAYSTQIGQLLNYQANNYNYASSIGVDPTTSGYFIKYPRQIRMTIDQLYGKGVSIINPSSKITIAIHGSDICSEMVDMFSHNGAELGHANDNTKIWTPFTAVEIQSICSSSIDSSKSYNINSVSDRSTLINDIAGVLSAIESQYTSSLTKISPTNLYLQEQLKR